MRKNTYYYPISGTYKPVQEDIIEECELTQEEIKQEIKVLGLENKTIEYLRNEVAILSLSNKKLQTQFDALFCKAKRDVLDLLKLGKGEKLNRGIVKTASRRFHSKGGHALNAINPQYLLRQELLNKAKQDIQSGLLIPGEKETWVDKMLRDSRYKGHGLSRRTLIDAIKFN